MSWKLFYSYSHNDADFREKLCKYLAPLRQQKKILEWHDRKIEPGADWNKQISAELNSANLIVLLISEEFLNSDYCFGIEMEKALDRLKRGEVKVVPVLVKPCLWKESIFSEMELIPRDGKPITSWTSREEAFVNVAEEISKMVSNSDPPIQPLPEPENSHRFSASLDLVRAQVHSYARLYERTRQRIKASNERTARMEQVFTQMRNLATASYPLLEELAECPCAGERLAAVSILQVFANEKFLPFLVDLVSSDKPFACYHAGRALKFAVSALDSSAHPQLLDALQKARAALDSAGVRSESGRQIILRDAQQELSQIIKSLAAPAVNDVD